MKKISKIFVFQFVFYMVILTAASAEELTLATVDTWPAISAGGFISCEEYEPANDRSFRMELLTSGLKALDADVIVLNGINPAGETAEMIAAELGMNQESWVSKAGVRVGPVSLPLNLQTGDAILTSERLTSEPVGRMHLDGLLSTGKITLLSKKGVQIFGRKIISGETGFYLFSVVWTESLFDDERSLNGLMKAYLAEEISAKEYTAYLGNAVEGSVLRAGQAAETLSFINSIAGESPVVIMGSLNALPESRELQLLKNAGFKDVFETAGKGTGCTVDVSGNTNFDKIPEDGISGAQKLLSGCYRSDYILIRGNELKAVAADVVLNKPVYGVYPSLHYGVRAVIRF